MNDRRDRRLFVDKAQIGEHAPFEIEKRMALAETDAVLRHRRCAGGEKVETADRGQFLEIDRAGEMFHAVEPCGKGGGIRRNHARRHVEKAALHVVGRHDKTLALDDQAAAQLDHGVVGRDESELRTGKGRKRRDAVRRLLDTFEIRNEFTEAQVKARVGASDSLEAIPNSLPNYPWLRHHGLCFNVS
ncbi:hypothetical protein D3C71_737150 [compost metagenome]